MLYLSDTLKLITKLGIAFTVFFNRNKLHAENLVVGSIEHELTAMIVKFYTHHRLHFSNATNKSLSSRWEKQKLLKMRRCK